MKIKFEWNENGSRGGMVYEADVMIKNMPLMNYKKWVKLFIKYGTQEQRNEFLALLNGYIMECKLLGADSKDRNLKQLTRKREILEGLIS